MKWSFARVAMIIGVFSALSIVGGLIKMPSPVGSIALDSAPGYFVASFYSPLLGAVVGTLGHLGSAATGGMPLGPLHFVIAPAMAIICGLFGWLARRGQSILYLIGSGVLAILLNGIGLPLLLTLVGLPRPVAWTIIPLLLIASAINVILAGGAAYSASRFRPGA
ncbi:MAG TPA: ECF transporter S component [Allosphingosinicella sp.]|nr:ECF transporter S component [Allosphingosinicella sp.]